MAKGLKIFGLKIFKKRFSEKIFFYFEKIRVYIMDAFTPVSKNSTTNILVKLLVAIVGFLIVALIVQLIWNAIVPRVFGFSKLTYVQAIGILILAKIFFSGMPMIVNWQ